MSKLLKIRIAMLFCGLLMAVFFNVFNLPLPWLLGPMLSTILLKLKYPSYVFFSINLRNVCLIPLGYNIGINITLAACSEISNQIGTIVLVNITSVLVSLALAWWTTRATGVSYASSSIGNMPGGLTPMLLICESIPQADINVVAVLQSLRLMGTIAIVPFLLAHGFGGAIAENAVLVPDYVDVPVFALIVVAIIGAIIGHKISLPAEFLLGPIITTGMFSIYMGGHLPEAPNWLLALSQIATGIYLGTCIDPYQLSKNKKLLPVALVGVFVIVGASIVIGLFLSDFMGFSVATAFLACAPGGIAEMCVTGMVMGENVSIILAYQLFRLLALNLAMPIFLKWYFGRQIA